MKSNYMIAALICASSFTAMASSWIQDDTFIESGFFTNTNHLEKATIAEEKKSYKSAAKSYDQLFNILTKTPNKSKALYLKAVNWENSGNFYEAMIAYKEQVNRFNDGNYFAPSLEALQRLGNYFRDNKDKWFSSNRDHAIDAYQTFLKVAPYYKSAPQVALDLAIIQESGLEIDKAIDHYDEVISKYQYDKEIKATALINLANICEKEAKRADSDVEISRRGV
ncbi:MAG: tetratricopeptide repeat protein, partial [Lentisphaeria bacterium]